MKLQYHLKAVYIWGTCFRISLPNGQPTLRFYYSKEQTKDLSGVYLNANEIASAYAAAYKMNWNPVKTTYHDCI